MKKYYIFRMNTLILNTMSIILFLLVCLLSFLINQSLFIESFFINDFPIFILEMILFTLMHEFLHSFAYVLNGAKFKNIYFGASLEKGILYCLCKERISKKNILTSLMFPFVIIGLITYVISLVFHLPRLLLLSLVNISGCSGDILMFNFISKLKNIEFSEHDREDEFAVYSSKKIDSGGLGIQYVKSSNSLEISNSNKIFISRFSIFAFVILMILSFVLI